MELGLKDKTFIVTGASSGLGLAGATVLADEGANLVISARNEQDITMAAAKIGHERVMGLAVDNADRRGAERLVAATFAKWGRIDGALISVGGPPPGGVLDTSESDWAAAIESVFLGGLRIARAVANAIGDAGGSIVFVLSSSVKSPIPNLAISNGLRPGLAMLAKTMADELGPRGIRVNGLMPGKIDTPRLRDTDTGRNRQRSLSSIPLGRYGEPAELGRVAAFLLSPAASYVTGAMIPVDGGMLRTI